MTAPVKIPEAADNGGALRAALASALEGRRKLAKLAGLQYGGDRDVYAAAGYLADSAVTFEHYWSIYQRQDIAGRIVDIQPMTTWRKPPEILDGGNPDTKFTAAVDGLAKSVRLFHYMERVDRLAGVGRYGILMIGASDVATDQDLAMPLGKLKGPESILFLQAFHEGDADIEIWDKDPASPRFGHPILYTLKISRGVTDFGEKDIRVHHSRVIHVAEDLLDNEVYGRPRLKRILNRLMDLDKVAAATGEAYWQLASRVLTAELAPDAQISDADMTKMGEALEEIQHDLRRQFLGQGAKLGWLSGEPPDPGTAADLFFTLIAAAAGIPKRILFGSETGERASTEDQKTWLGSIAERQQRFAEPGMLRPFLDRLVGVGALPSASAAGYTLVWPALFQAPEKELAETSKLAADAARLLTPIGGQPLDLVEIDEERRVRLRPTGDRDPLSEEDLGPPPVVPPSFVPAEGDV